MIEIMVHFSLQAAQAVVQETPQITDFMEMVQQYPFETALAFLLWGLAGFFAFLLAVGKAKIPAWVINIVFILIIAGLFLLALKVNPHLVELLNTNFLQFGLALLTSAVVGIFFVPFIAASLIGFALGNMRSV